MPPTPDDPRECPVLVDTIDRLWEDISESQSKSHLSDDEAKALSEAIFELIRQIINEYEEINARFTSFYLNIRENPEHQPAPVDELLQLEENIAVCKPSELPLLAWAKRHHHRASKFAGLSSTMDIIEALKPCLRGRSLADLVGLGPLECLGIRKASLLLPGECPKPCFGPLVESRNRLQGVLEIMTPIVRSVRRMKRSLDAGPTTTLPSASGLGLSGLRAL